MDRELTWKAFQIQSSLLCQRVGEEAMTEAKEWLQPKQFYDVIVERNVTGRCGLPTCGNLIRLRGAKVWMQLHSKVICKVKFERTNSAPKLVSKR